MGAAAPAGRRALSRWAQTGRGRPLSLPAGGQLKPRCPPTVDGRRGVGPRRWGRQKGRGDIGDRSPSGAGCWDRAPRSATGSDPGCGRGGGGSPLA